MAVSAPLSVILVAVLFLAVWYDVTERRLPNWITVGGLLVALVVRGGFGLDVLWAGLLGGGLGLALGFIFFVSGAMGAGDGKFLAAVGALLGLQTFLWCLPLIGVFGGLVALAATISNGTVRATLLRLKELVLYLVSFGRLGDVRTVSTPGAATVPYGVAVAAGAVTAWLGWGVSL
jgi:prepilin peptidase CpaA